MTQTTINAELRDRAGKGTARATHSGFRGCGYRLVGRREFRRAKVARVPKGRFREGCRFKADPFDHRLEAKLDSIGNCGHVDFCNGVLEIVVRPGCDAFRANDGKAIGGAPLGAVLRGRQDHEPLLDTGDGAFVTVAEALAEDETESASAVEVEARRVEQLIAVFRP